MSDGKRGDSALPGDAPAAGEAATTDALMEPSAKSLDEPPATASAKEALSSVGEASQAVPAHDTSAAPRREEDERSQVKEAEKGQPAATGGKWEVRPAADSTLVTVVLHGLYDNRLVDLNEWPSFYEDMQDEVEKECGRHGEVLRCFVDRKEPRGSLWLCFAAPAQAQACREAMDQRYYAGRRVTAEIHSSDIWVCVP